MTTTLRSALLLALALLPASLPAQPSATMRTGLLDSFSAEFAASSSEPIARSGVSFGDVAVRSLSLSASGRRGLDPTTVFIYGAGFVRHDLDADTAFLPGQLTELSLNLGVQRRLSAQWSAAAFVRPGFYGDDLSGRSLNAPLLLMGTFIASPTLAWSVGLNANAFAQYPVLPIAGVRWQFAPDWTFSVGFPLSGVSWRTSETLTLRAGVGFNGGSFRVNTDHGSPAAGIGRLTGTYVDYREVRVGVGADFALGGGLSLTVNAGAMTDRRFDYFDRDFVLNGDAGLYGTVSFHTRF